MNRGFGQALPAPGLARSLPRRFQLLGFDDFFDGAFAFQPGQIVDKQNAFQVIHFMLNADGIKAGCVFCDPFTVIIQIGDFHFFRAVNGFKTGFDTCFKIGFGVVNIGRMVMGGI